MSKSPVEAPPGTVDLNTMMVLTDLTGKIAKTEALIEVFTNKSQREMELMESRLNKRIDDVTRQIQREMELMESRLNKRIDDVARNIIYTKKDEPQLSEKERTRQKIAQSLAVGMLVNRCLERRPLPKIKEHPT